MKLIVGLGNPGKEYEMTRHNSGFCVLDAIAEECRVDVTQKKFKALIANTRISGEAVVLMKPQTFMNLSGEAVRAAMDFYKLSAQDLLVIYDDLDLPANFSSQLQVFMKIWASVAPTVMKCRSSVLFCSLPNSISS